MARNYEKLLWKYCFRQDKFNCSVFNKKIKSAENT